MIVRSIRFDGFYLTLCDSANIAPIVEEDLTMQTTVREAVIVEFEAAAKAAVATVDIIDRTPDALAKAILAATGDANRILFARPQDLPAELFSQVLRHPHVSSNPTPEQWVDSPVGVTEAFAGVARTGSVCVDVGYEQIGMASLLTPLHIAVVAAETIVPQPRDLFRADILGGKGLTRSFVFITGPSATADMGPLVRGVHGPHRLHIIVLRST